MAQVQGSLDERDGPEELMSGGKATDVFSVALCVYIRYVAMIGIFC